MSSQIEWSEDRRRFRVLVFRGEELVDVGVWESLKPVQWPWWLPRSPLHRRLLFVLCVLSLMIALTLV